MPASDIKLDDDVEQPTASVDDDVSDAGDDDAPSADLQELVLKADQRARAWFSLENERMRVCSELLNSAIQMCGWLDPEDRYEYGPNERVREACERIVVRAAGEVGRLLSAPRTSLMREAYRNACEQAR
jgi:hypothetical protein